MLSIIDDNLKETRNSHLGQAWHL